MGVPAGDALPDENCVTTDVGVIMWTCQTHAFIARDDTGAGNEDAIAAALRLAADRAGICDIGDTLVLLARTEDTVNGMTLAQASERTQQVAAYYQQIASGAATFAYTFLDADGAAGAADAYVVGPTLAAYAGKECDFARDALEKAFAGGLPREELTVERAIVVYPGLSKQQDPAAPLKTACCQSRAGEGHTVSVGPPLEDQTLYVKNLILMSEQYAVGPWVHEVGHSLASKYVVGGVAQIGDRYNYTEPWGQYGDVDYWDLMGRGSNWGTPDGSAPVQMSSFTKESAGWLSLSRGRAGARAGPHRARAHAAGRNSAAL